MKYTFPRGSYLLRSTRGLNEQPGLVGSEMHRTDRVGPWQIAAWSRAATEPAHDCDPKANVRLRELEAMAPGTGRGPSRVFCSTGREELGVQFWGGT